MTYSLVRVALDMESSVSRTLTALDFAHSIFRIRRKTMSRGRLVEQIAPIYPGYIFVLARGAWTTIKHIIGVRGFVSFGNMPCAVPDSVIEALQSQSDEHGVIMTELPGAPFRPGEAIQVTLRQGTVLTGQFQHLLPPDRATVLVEIMGRMACVNVPLCECKALPSAPKRKQRHR
jgi:transcription antitermination factor NusG